MTELDSHVIVMPTKKETILCKLWFLLSVVVRQKEKCRNADNLIQLLFKEQKDTFMKYRDMPESCNSRQSNYSELDHVYTYSGWREIDELLLQEMNLGIEDVG